MIGGGDYEIDGIRYVEQVNLDGSITYKYAIGDTTRFLTLSDMNAMVNVANHSKVIKLI
jgi:hypothetical protein